MRLHSAIGFVTPKDMLEGRAPAIFAGRDKKLEKLAPGAQRTGRPATTNENPPGRSISLA